MDTHLLDYPGAWRTDDGSSSSSSSSLPGRREAAASEILSDTGLCRPGAPSTRRSLPPYFNFKSSLTVAPSVHNAGSVTQLYFGAHGKEDDCGQGPVKFVAN